ncbi:MAG TPA: DUF4160 domain-containing protein [Pyrinomonadaceae bacterium]
MIYTQDHITAHVHIWRAGGEIIINIASFEIIKVEGMSRRDSAKVVEIVEASQEYLLERWHEIHG